MVYPVAEDRSFCSPSTPDRFHAAGSHAAATHWRRSSTLYAEYRLEDWQMNYYF
jgi:hypothetical protein